jgi:hypothetical protein
VKSTWLTITALIAAVVFLSAFRQTRYWDNDDLNKDAKWLYDAEQQHSGWSKSALDQIYIERREKAKDICTGFEKYMVDYLMAHNATELTPFYIDAERGRVAAKNPKFFTDSKGFLLSRAKIMKKQVEQVRAHAKRIAKDVGRAKFVGWNGIQSENSKDIENLLIHRKWQEAFNIIFEGENFGNDHNSWGCYSAIFKWQTVYDLLLRKNQNGWSKISPPAWMKEKPAWETVVAPKLKSRIFLIKTKGEGKLKELDFTFANELNKSAQRYYRDVDREIDKRNNLLQECEDKLAGKTKKKAQNAILTPEETVKEQAAVAQEIKNGSSADAKADNKPCSDESVDSPKKWNSVPVMVASPGVETRDLPELDGLSGSPYNQALEKEDDKFSYGYEPFEVSVLRLLARDFKEAYDLKEKGKMPKSTYMVLPMIMSRSKDLLESWDAKCGKSAKTCDLHPLIHKALNEYIGGILSAKKFAGVLEKLGTKKDMLERLAVTRAKFGQYMWLISKPMFTLYGRLLATDALVREIKEKNTRLGIDKKIEEFYEDEYVKMPAEDETLTLEESITEIKFETEKLPKAAEWFKLYQVLFKLALDASNFKAEITRDDIEKDVKDQAIALNSALETHIKKPSETTLEKVNKAINIYGQGLAEYYIELIVKLADAREKLMIIFVDAGRWDAVTKAVKNHAKDVNLVEEFFGWEEAFGKIETLAQNHDLAVRKNFKDRYLINENDLSKMQYFVIAGRTFISPLEKALLESQKKRERVPKRKR